MIPDHLIDKALDAWIGDHNCPHPDLIRAYRVLVTRSLEAVAADIWDRGHVCGYSDAQDTARGIRLGAPHPYKRNENA